MTVMSRIVAISAMVVSIRLEPDTRSMLI